MASVKVFGISLPIEEKKNLPVGFKKKKKLPIMKRKNEKIADKIKKNNPCR